MTPHTLKDWRARRAGGRITVYGECTKSGQLAKITQVDEIKPGDGGKCIATDKNKVAHTLLPR